MAKQLFSDIHYWGDNSQRVTVDELVKLNERLDRYENYVKKIVHSIRDVFSDRWGWYLVGYIMGSA